MFRFAGIGLFGFVALGLWIYCILDVIASEESLIRNLPKMAWLFVVVFIPTIGSVAWLGLGRPLYAGIRPGDTTSRRQPRSYGPEDDPNWSPGAIDKADDDARRLRAKEAELERRERELERRERGNTDPET